MQVIELQLHPRDEADLRWLFNEADGEMGLKSNFEAMRARLEVGGRTGGKPVMDLDPRAIAAATRARGIRRKLEGIGKGHERTLRVLFGPDQKGTVPLPAFGRLGALVHASEAAKHAHFASCSSRTFEEWLVRLSWRVSRGKGATIHEDRQLVRELIRDAERTRIAAVRAYRTAARG